jgi:signal transduction histidine kinase
MTSYIKFKGILISLLIGIVFLQGLWISNAYNERKAHLNTHIENALNHAIIKYCNNNPEPYLLSDSILTLYTRNELLFLEESPRFTLKIIDRIVVNNNINPNLLNFKIRCADSNKYILVEINLIDENKYILGSLLSWIGLSIIFLILLAIFTTIYLRNLNIQGQIQKMKDEFTSNMTHELKTPISTISVASEILQNDKVNKDFEKIKRYSTIIHEENNRLKRLVDRVMQVALFESGKLNVSLTKENINQIIEDVCIPLEILVSKHGGSLKLDIDPNNPEIPIDKIHFSNIISNLVENALKYNNSKPEINISTKLTTKEFTIEISDNGIGIEKDKIKHIFKKYYRVKGEDTKRKTGFGLGLFYVYQIVKAHKADIKVESKLNIGTTFKISFTI